MMVIAIVNHAFGIHKKNATELYRLENARHFWWFAGRVAEIRAALIMRDSLFKLSCHLLLLFD